MAATLRWSSASDLPTWDIHSQNNALGNGIHAMVYEALFTYDERFEVVPELATGAKALSPTQLRVSLRRGVRFHDGSAFTELPARRIETTSTHGTGCTLASAIAALLARGESLEGAIRGAKAYVTEAIERAYPIGKGHGPVHHFHRWW